MTKPIVVFGVLGAVLLSACGGGGRDPAPQPVPPQPASGPLVLTESNAVDATSLVMRLIEHVHVEAETMLFTTTVLGFFRSASQTVLLCGDVPAQLTNFDRDRSGGPSAGDTLRFGLSACAGITRDSTLEISALDYAAGILEGRVTFSESADTGTRTEGSFRYALSFDRRSLSQTQTMREIDVAVTNGGTTARVRDAESVRYTQHETYRITLSGRSSSPALGGDFTFTTGTPLVGDFGAVPSSGELVLTGGASRVRVTPSADASFREDHFAYVVDATGAGTHAPARHDRWSRAIIGLIFCWDGNTKPRITSLSLGPTSPTAHDPLVASYTASDADGEPLFYFPEWRVNDQLVQGDGDGTTLSPGRFKKGDVVTFLLRVLDGRAGAHASASTTIINSAPRFTGISIAQPVARTTDDLSIEYGAADNDRDELEVTFEWLRDGVPIEGQTSTVLPHTQHARGETITAVVRISDGEATTSATASIVIADTPPVITLPFEHEPVPYGETVTFDVTASDVDGESTGQFILRYGPAGMTVDPTTGRVSWPMRGPAFEPFVSMQYGITLDVANAPLAEGSVALSRPDREPARFATGVEAPATSGLITGDFDNDGDEELLVAGKNVLYALEWTAAGLQQSWVYAQPFNMMGPPTALAAADVDGDGLQEIFVAHGDHVTKLDGVDRRAIASRRMGPTRLIRDLEIADLDANGRADLVAIATLDGAADPAAEGIVRVFDAASMSTSVDYPITEGSDIAVGNVDADTALEIVTNSGYVFDVFNWQNHWRYPAPFGWQIAVGDLDGDGVDEIVGSVDDASVRAYDGVTRTATWTVANANTDAIVIADVLGDARNEVVIGDGSGGSRLVKVYAQTAPSAVSLVAAASAVGDDVPAITVGDIDRDGQRDLIWGSATPYPSVTIAGGTPLDVEWTTADLPYGALLGPYVGGELARAPGNVRAVLFATMDSPYDGARLIRMDATTGDLAVGSGLGEPGNGHLALTVADYDMDGRQEALIASSDGVNAYHRAVDVFADDLEWNAPFASAQSGVAVAYGDVVGDGRAEIAAIDGDGVIRAYEIGSSTPFWTSSALSSGQDVVVAEVNGTGRPEIVAAAADRVFVFSRDDDLSYVQTRMTPPLPGLRDIEVGDVDGDGVIDILALYGSALSDKPTSVQRLDGNLVVRGEFDYWRWVRGFTIERSTYPRKNLAFIETNDGDQIVVVDADTGDEVWESPTLLGTIPRHGVHFVDADDGTFRISAATSVGMYLTR